MKSAFAKALVFAAAVFAVQTPAFADVPSSFKIKTLTFAGTGCPAGSVAGNVSPDLQAFTLLFDSYAAEAGPGVSLSASRRNCQLNITFDCPDGWQFALIDVDTRGYAALDFGVNALARTAFYFQGDAGQGSVERTLYGPTNEDYQYRDTIPAPSRVWGKCGFHARALNVNTSVRVDNSRNRGGQGLITVDSVDGSLREVFGLSWQRSVD